jgi:MFS family permease
MDKKPFYGWWVTAAAICTFGIAVGIPYYNMPFFYDYYEKSAAQGGFGWSRDQITLGFPLAALFTLWVGPALVHRFSPRKLLLIGTALTAAAFIGFSRMSGDITIYYVFWFLYTVGYIFSGPIPHQVIISQWFRRKRGRAMGITYVGVAIFGSLGSYIVKPLTESLGFRGALAVMGGLMFLAWPFALFIIRDRPAEKGLYPDNDPAPLAVPVAPPQSMGSMLKTSAFWLLVIGSLCSIGSIGAINQHMKLVFKDHGFVDQAVLNSTWRTASILILWSSIAGRLLIGWAADRFPKKYVMTGTYVLVAATIPLLLLVTPERRRVPVYLRDSVRLRNGRRLHADPVDGRRAVRGEHAGAGDGDHSPGRHHWANLVPVLRVPAAEAFWRLRARAYVGVRAGGDRRGGDCASPQVRQEG